MNHTQPSLIIVALVLLLAITVLPGCSRPVEAEVVNHSGYVGALSAAYEGALDATAQLALGTLELEGTADAVTGAQAAELLPLWQALDGSELQGSAERNAVPMQIEATMTADQITSIAAMHLTEDDAQLWMESQRSGAAVPGRQRAEGAAQGLSVEEIAGMRAPPSGGGAAGSASYGLIRAVVELLAERSGSAAVETAAPETEPVAVEPVLVIEPAAATQSAVPSKAVAEAEVQMEPAAASELDKTPEPTPIPVASGTTAAEEVTVVAQAGDTLAAIARAYGVTVEAVVAANELPDADVIVVGQELTIPDSAQVPAVTSTTSSALATDRAQGAVQRLPGLEQIPDTDPGPPFTIEISANYATQDPLVEKSRTYVVTGIVRNDGDETYAVSDILITFYDADGFRGTFSPAIRDGKLVGGEWHWHGEVQAEFAALLLAPGEEWPFSVTITAQDMASFLIHPDAAPTGREPAQVELSDIRLVDEGTGYVRISGTATNASTFGVKNVTVSGVLTDAGGLIVSLGSTYVLQQGVEPGASVRFDVRIEETLYVGYQLYAQAERDWE